MKPPDYKKSLEFRYPEVAKEWDYAKNDFTPKDVTAVNDRKVNWVCKKDNRHKWPAVISNRTKRGSGCPYCDGKKVLPEDSFGSLYPDLLKEYSPSNETSPFTLAPFSNKSVQWICSKNNLHTSWPAVVISRTKLDSRCPCCTGQRPWSGNNLSLCANGILNLWDYENNPSPKEFLPMSSQKVKWKCEAHPTHRWPATIANVQRSIKKGNNGCSYCSGKLVNESNSFGSKHPDLLSEWDYEKNKVDPFDVYENSTHSYFWKCPKGDDHKWPTSIANRVGNIGKAPTNCSICSHNKCVPSVSLEYNHPELMKEWDWDLNTVDPIKIFPNYSKKVCWVCKSNKEHRWKATPNKRAGLEKTGCPFCNVLPQSKIEIAIACELSLFFNCINNGKKLKFENEYLSPDIIIPDLKLVIEYDGSYWHKDKIDKDKIKTDKLYKLGFRVVRIREGSLEKITPIDITGYSGREVKPIVNSILEMIRKDFSIDDSLITPIEEYLKRDYLQNSKLFEKRMASILRKKSKN